MLLLILAVLLFHQLPTPVDIDSLVKLKKLREVHKFLEGKYFKRTYDIRYEIELDEYITTELYAPVTFYGCVGTLKIESRESDYSCQFVLSFDKRYWFDWWAQDVTLRNYVPVITEPTTQKANELKDSLMKYFGKPIAQGGRTEASPWARWYKDSASVSLTYWDELGFLVLDVHDNYDTSAPPPPSHEDSIVTQLAPIRIDSLIQIKDSAKAITYLGNISIVQQKHSRQDTGEYIFYGVKLFGEVGWVTLRYVGNETQYQFQLACSYTHKILDSFPYLSVVGPQRCSKLKDSLDGMLGEPFSQNMKDEPESSRYHLSSVWYKDSVEIRLRSYFNGKRRECKINMEFDKLPPKVTPMLTVPQIVDSLFALPTMSLRHSFLQRQALATQPRAGNLTEAGYTFFPYHTLPNQLRDIYLSVDTNETKCKIIFSSQYNSDMKREGGWQIGDTLLFEEQRNIMSIINKYHGKPVCADAALKLPAYDDEGNYLYKEGRINTCSWKRGKLVMTTTGSLFLEWDFRSRK